MDKQFEEQAQPAVRAVTDANPTPNPYLYPSPYP